MKHVIAYDGLVGTSLGLMQEHYVRSFIPWLNRRVGVEGTLQQPPYSHEAGLDWVRGFKNTKGKDEVFAILEQQGRGRYRYVGHTGIHQVMWPHAIAKTGSIIGAKGAQGHGLGTEAKLLLQYHAFYILGLRKLCSTVKAWNAQSLGHLIKCGYQIVGRQKEHHFHEGAFIDEILLEVFRKDWEPIWERYQKTKQLPKLAQAQRALIKKETGQ